MTDEMKEPTTETLFATVREELTGIEQQAHDLGLWKLSERTRDTLAAIALLERRMGATERAARPLLKLVRGECGPVGRAMADALDAAFTDAPPVFTPEEVVRAVREYTGSEMVAEDVRDALVDPRIAGSER